MVLRMQHLVVGAVGFGTAVYGGYTFAKKQQGLSAVTASDSNSLDEGHTGCAFDRLAGAYDDIVGWEETGMQYGVMRWWLLRKAQGDVLELSAGTGRNLPYFQYDSMSSLTLTDVSTSMLQQAQRKFFDDMQLQYKHLDLTCKFFLADAQHLVAEPGQQPHAVLLPPYSSRRSVSSSSGSTAQATSGGIWRLKQAGGGGGDSSTSSAVGAGASEAGPASAGSTLNSGTRLTPSTSENPTSSNTGSSSSSGSTSSTSRTSSSCSGRGWRWSKQQHLTQDDTPAVSTSSRSDSDITSSSSSSTFAPHSFDVVVDTFGLCSCEDPVKVLQQAALLLKPGGKLLLLEHGRGKYDWINKIIDDSAARHHKTFGCWYNRDILSIVEDAGLKVESLSRWHFGTSYMIVASPATEQQQVVEAAAAAQAA